MQPTFARRASEALYEVERLLQNRIEKRGLEKSRVTAAREPNERQRQPLFACHLSSEYFALCAFVVMSSVLAQY